MKTEWRWKSRVVMKTGSQIVMVVVGVGVVAMAVGWVGRREEIVSGEIEQQTFLSRDSLISERSSSKETSAANNFDERESADSPDETHLSPALANERAQAPTTNISHQENNPTISPFSPTLTLIAGGDVMLGRAVNATQVRRNNFNFAWEGIGEMMRAADIAMVNLETPLVKGCQVVVEGMSFCAGERAAEGVAGAGIDIVNLANNHTLNYGKEGLAETKNLLAQKGISYVGENGDGYGGLVVKNIRGVKVGVLGFDDVTQTLDREKVRRQVAEAAVAVNTLVVSVHWGVEYEREPRQRQVELARLMIDSGVDLIIGHHPHWRQTTEVYRGKMIYYSLGNLIFDQLWSEETRQGLVVEFIYRNGEWEMKEERQIYINATYQPEVVE